MNPRWVVILIAGVFGLSGILNPDFFRITLQDGHFSGSIIDVLNRAVPTALAALGMSLVIACAGVDLSVGSVAAVSGALLAVLSQNAALALAGALTAGAVCGFFNGTFVAKLRLQPIVATLVLMTAGRGIAQLIGGGQVITLQSETLKSIGNQFLIAIPIPIWFAATAYAALAILCSYTALGMFLRATGSNESASSIAGISTTAVKWTAYTLCGLLAGTAGIIIAADIGASDSNNAGQLLELDAILAACIGGNLLTGGRLQIGGALLGAILMQSLTTSMLTLGIAPEYSLIAKAVLILVIGYFQFRPGHNRVRLISA